MFVHGRIVGDHPVHRKVAFDVGTAICPVQLVQLCDGCHHLIDRIDYKTSDAVFYDLGYRTPVHCQYRRTAGHCFDHIHTEGLLPLDGHEQGLGILVALHEFVAGNIAEVLDLIVKMRPDLLVKVLAIIREHRPGDVERHLGSLGYFNCLTDTLLGNDTAGEQQVAIVLFWRLKGLQVDPVINSGRILEMRLRGTLTVRD